METHLMGKAKWNAIHDVCWCVVCVVIAYICVCLMNVNVFLCHIVSHILDITITYVYMGKQNQVMYMCDGCVARCTNIHTHVYT